MKQQIKKNSKIISEYRRNFCNIYHNKIVPVFSQFERERKSELTSLVCFEVVILGILLTSIFSYFNASNVNPFLLMFSPFICIACFILLVWLPIRFNRKFTKKLKNTCMPKVVSVFENMRWYDCFVMISDDEMTRSQLFGLYNRRHSFDAFEGIYKNVPFKMAETEMWHESGSGKNRRVVPIFKGVAIKFKANKNIKNTTIVATKNDKSIKNNSVVGLVGLIGLYQFFLPNSSGEFDIFSIILGVIVLITILVGFYFINKARNKEVLNEMKLEDPEFNKKYKAYSSDQIEGRYLITPAFIERFNNLQTAFGTNKAKCSFYGDEIMFAISTDKNLFEIGNLFHNLNNPKQMEVFFNELSSILALVDYFKLDEKTGL